MLRAQHGSEEAGDTERVRGHFSASPCAACTPAAQSLSRERLRQLHTDPLLLQPTDGAVTVSIAPKAKPSLDPGMAVRHPSRILLAEVNVVNQKLAMRLLQQVGYRAGLASNYIEAIERVQRQSYDVVLMDVRIPEMDGLDARWRITAKWQAHERPRIAAMIAKAMHSDR